VNLLLYYAGMAADGVTEQIGLAVSNGQGFERVRADGLIIAADPSYPWRALRVCNPTVIVGDPGFVMYFQGIADGLHHTSIGVARSDDGIEWEVDAEPSLGWQAMEGVDPTLDSTARVGLWEPAILVEDGRLRMWFVYSHVSQPGNSIWYAERAGDEPWRLAARPLLTGRSFGNFDIHYPQMIRTATGYELWFTLRNVENGVDGIFVARSAGGEEWESPHQVLPRSARGISLKKKRIVPAKVAAVLNRVAPAFGQRFVSRAEKEARRRFSSFQRNALGYAHSHVLTAGDETLFVFHNDHEGDRGRWMDVSLATLEGGAVRDADTILTPGPPDAWDGYFVADPFLIVR
jgi:hypothetical protein